MSPDPHDFHDLRNRIVNLEKQNRRLKRLGAVALIGVTLVLVMAQAPLKRRVEANEFILNDSSGNVRARLSVANVGLNSVPQMVFLDNKGQTNLELDGANGLLGGSVGIFDQQGGHVGGFLANKDGGHLWLSKREGSASRTEVGPVSVEISDEEGFSATLGTGNLVAKTGETHRTSAASLVLGDKDKHIMWRAP